MTVLFCRCRGRQTKRFLFCCNFCLILAAGTNPQARPLARPLLLRRNAPSMQARRQVAHPQPPPLSGGHPRQGGRFRPVRTDRQHHHSLPQGYCSFLFLFVPFFSHVPCAPCWGFCGLSLSAHSFRNKGVSLVYCLVLWASPCLFSCHTAESTVCRSLKVVPMVLQQW